MFWKLKRGKGERDILAQGLATHADPAIPFFCVGEGTSGGKVRTQTTRNVGVIGVVCRWGGLEAGLLKVRGDVLSQKQTVTA